MRHHGTRPAGHLVVVSDVPNALALGRDPKSAILVVTSGLEESLGLVELEGVLAHELVHIKRNDTVLAAVAVVVAAPLGRCCGALRPASTPSTGWSAGAASSPPTSGPPLIVRYPTGIGSALETMVASDPMDSAGRRPRDGWPR